MVKTMPDWIDRRVFLQRTAVLIPFMHAAGTSTIMGQSKPTSLQTPSNGRISRLKLQSHRLPETAKFYRETIGLPVNVASDGSFTMTCGETLIEFHKAEGESQPFYHFAFNIPHNKLDKAIEWMKPRHPLFVREDGSVVFHFERWDAHAVYFIDPSGNIVEFIARHTLKNDAPGSFDVRDILYASEIGVVTPDVDATADNLKRGLDLDNYKTASDGFAPIGDEHGLFIVFKVGRIWLASDRGTSVFPAEATVRGAAKPLSIDRARFAVNAGD